MGIIAVTNNSLVSRAMGDKNIFSQIIFSHCSLEGILKISLGMAKNGHTLLLHPLLGNVPPFEMPFKTIVLTESSGIIDFNSLSVLSRAALDVESALNRRTKSVWGKNDLDDFKKNDLVIVERWLTKVYFPEWQKSRGVFNEQ